MILPSAIVVTSLLVAIDIIQPVLLDPAGELYSQYSFWLSAAWVLLSLTWLVGLGLAIANTISSRQKLRLRALWPLAVYALGAILVWGLWTLSDSPSTYSDAAMIEHFFRYEAELNQLREMFAQDSQVSWVCRPSNDFGPGLTAERAKTYEALLGTVRIGHGIMREPRGETLFRYWTKPATGFADQNVEKGYAVLDRPPSRLVDSLDNPTRLGEGLTYRQISGQWYLYVYNRDSLKAVCDLRM
jgi:hypothetical protein